MNGVRNSVSVASGTVDPRSVELELALGLAPEDAVLDIEQSSQRQDLQPWLLDAVAVRIACLGHQDEVPRPWDWENVLTLLEPGEELLYVLDHHAADAGRAGTFKLWMAIRFPAFREIDQTLLELREQRARVLISQIHRQAFPGTEIEWIEPHQVLAELTGTTGPEQRCVAISGMPSPRSLDDEARDIDREAATRNYQSLNDVVEALYDLGCDYRIAFAVQRVSANQLQAVLAEKTALYDRVHPLVEVTRRAGENWANQRGENWADAQATGENTATQHGKNKGINVNLGPAGAAGGAAVGFLVGGPPGAAIGAGLGALAGVIGFQKGSSTSQTHGRSWTHTSTVGGSTSSTDGGSRDITLQQVSSLLRLSDGSLERTISSIHEAYGTGGFRWGAFAFAKGHNVEIVGRSIMGVLAGARTKDNPLVRFEIRGEQSKLLSSRTPAMEIIANAAPVLSLPRVCDALLVPEAELPGLRLRRNVFLGRNVDAPNVRGTDAVVLGLDAFSASGSEVVPAEIRVPAKDLFRHVLVSGTTGSGKTTRVVETLNQLHWAQLSVVVFETAKRTYRDRLQRRARPAPIVYRLGCSSRFTDPRHRPLRLNPFYFELGTSLKRHIAVLSDALAELMPTEAMIGPIMRRAVEACYDERGWDIESGQPCSGEPSWPTVIDFVVQTRALAEQLQYGPEVNANYRGALESRAALFLDATFQDIFGYAGNAPIDQIFPPGHDAIIEVEELPPSDVDIRAFVMTLLLDRLRAVQGSRRRAAAPAEQPAVEAEPHFEPLEKVLVRFFGERVPRPSNHAKKLIDAGKVAVDGSVVRSRTRAVTLNSRIVADGEPVDVYEVLGAPASPTAPQLPPERQILDEKREWLIVVEEAHNVLDRQFEQRRPADESNAGRTLLRAVVRLLQEGRQMGIGMMIVDQSPTRLARDVIANTGTKITLRLEDADEMKEIGRAMGLEQDAWQKLGFLGVGEALVKTSVMDRPAKSAKYRVPEQEEEPADPASLWSPSYTELAKIWNPVIAGTAAEPGHDWIESIGRCAHGDVHLATFAGLRTLLSRNQSGHARESAPLRSVLANELPEFKELLGAARNTWAATVASTYRQQLELVAALIGSALIRSSPWTAEDLSLDGLAFASRLLDAAGLGSHEEWLRLLTVAAAASPGTPAAEHLVSYAIQAGRGDRTAAIRLLLRAAWPACEFDSVMSSNSQEVAAARLQTLVNPILAPPKETAKQQVFTALVDEVITKIVSQISLPQHVTKVREDGSLIGVTGGKHD